MLVCFKIKIYVACATLSCKTISRAFTSLLFLNQQNSLIILLYTPHTDFSLCKHCLSHQLIDLVSRRQAVCKKSQRIWGSYMPLIRISKWSLSNGVCFSFSSLRRTVCALQVFVTGDSLKVLWKNSTVWFSSWSLLQP